MDSFFYQKTGTGALREAWLMFWTPAWRTVGFVVAALALLTALLKVPDNAVLISIATIAGFALTFVVLAIGNRFVPMRKHWRTDTDESSDWVIFNLRSLHNHLNQVHSVRFILTLPDGQELTQKARALNVRPADLPVYFQYPHGFAGHETLMSGIYIFTWYVNTAPDERWLKAGQGSYTH